MCMMKDASFFERRAEEMQHLVRKMRQKRDAPRGREAAGCHSGQLGAAIGGRFGTERRRKRTEGCG